VIVPMLKTYVAARQQDRQRLLEALRDLGVVHLAPVDPAKAAPDDKTLAAIDTLARAAQMLGEPAPRGEKGDLAPLAAAEEVLEIHRRAAERRSRLAGLHRQVEQLAVWGDATLEQFTRLAEAGVNVRFYSVPRDAAGEVRADCVQVLGELAGKRILVAAASSGQSPVEAPEAAEALELPSRDRPSLRAEAGEIDAALAADEERLGVLAHLRDDMEAERRRLERKAEYAAASNGGLHADALYAVQGWVPADKAEALSGGLAEAGVPAGVQTAPPREGEAPPTLVVLPRWARPIQGLMKILGIQPGYGEPDVSVAFMIALPIFAAMLFSDGGYGLTLLLLPIVLRRKVIAKMGRNVANLTMVIGALSMAWGALTGSFFGMDVPGLLGGKPLIAVSLDAGPMNFLMRLSFTIGVVHLVVAQLWRGVRLWPNLALLSKVGWAAFLVGMYSVVTHFVLGRPAELTSPAIIWPCMIGGGMAILFASPSWNVPKMVALGLANFPLAALGTFSDIMSYVRLMAVGLAGSVLATSFNELAMRAGPVLLVPILIFGHGLNLGLCLIALFAHGVRLNVLEFSNNLGLEWSGYPYQPFGSDQPQET